MELRLDSIGRYELEQLTTKYRNALVQVSKMGAVCKDFDICKHASCSDSCGAVLVALEALK